MRLRLVNPNSDAHATGAMLDIASASAPEHVVIEATTSTRAVRLITDPQALAEAQILLLDLFEGGLDPLDGVIIAAFGDPGVAELRHRLRVPVTGIAEAALFEAAEVGPFAVCSTTPALGDAIRGRAVELGLGDGLVAVRATCGDPRLVMADEHRLDTALAELIELAIRHDGAEAVIIGGGPLAPAARRLAPVVRVPIVEPVPAAVRRLCAAVRP